ncbi:MAG: hypothetical protein ACLU62_07615 [Hydrogeniiclostridium sp.]
MWIKKLFIEAMEKEWIGVVALDVVWEEGGHSRRLLRFKKTDFNAHLGGFIFECNVF